MARSARIALDFALVSLRTVRPAVTTVWTVAKTSIVSTPARRLVDNVVVEKLETTLDRVTQVLETKITEIRDQRLKGELKYLEKEVENVKKRIGQPTSESLKPKIAAAWQYAKLEMAPPGTLGFLYGPIGKKIEELISMAADGFVGKLQRSVKNMDEEEERSKLEVEIATKTEEEKIAQAVAAAKEKEAKKLGKKAETKSEKSDKGKK